MNLDRSLVYTRVVHVEDGMLAILRVFILDERGIRRRLQLLLLGQVDSLDFSKGQKTLLDEFVCQAVGRKSANENRSLLFHFNF